MVEMDTEEVMGLGRAPPQRLRRGQGAVCGVQEFRAVPKDTGNTLMHLMHHDDKKN
jgi:hypothetical protein